MSCRIPSQCLSIFTALFVLTATACGGGDEGVTGDGGIEGDASAPSVALLEIHMLDIWAQPLPADGTSLSVTLAGNQVPTSGAPLVTVPLTGSGRYDIALEAEGHVPLAVSAMFDGTSDLDALTVSTPTGDLPHGLSVSHETRMVNGRSIPVHTIHTGLRHRWFSAQGRPARHGNRIRLMTSGEAALAQVAEDIREATDHVHISTWWWESDLELVRDEATHVMSTPEERQPNTVIGMLDASSATKRVLVNQFISLSGTWLSTDSTLRDRGAAAGDNFEFMGQANQTRGMFEFQIAPFSFGERVRMSFPDLATRMFDVEVPIQSIVPSHPVDLTSWPVSADFEIASYHQKFMALDGRVAFVGGMNMRSVDWDTDEHLVFEPRRMFFDATTSNRMAVAAHERMPDRDPRKDFMTRIEGPLVQDVEEMFHQRWATQLEAGAVHAENASDFTVIRGQSPFDDGVQAQLTATLPEPYNEHAIAETWWNAIANAEKYIYIEDQYFRIPMLVDLIIERMTEVPTLELVVITPAVNEFTDPGCEWTYRTSEMLENEFPDRFHLFRLRSFDTQIVFGIQGTESRFVDINLHSKMLIVDDVFMSIGSANKNNRGIVYEAELNVAIYDRAWVEAARRRILSLILPSSVTPADTAGGESGWVAQLEAAAMANQSVWDAWDATGGDLDLNENPLPAEYTPAGFLYPLVFRAPSECLIEGVGPDMT